MHCMKIYYTLYITLNIINDNSSDTEMKEFANSELENLKTNSYTNPIKIGNNYLILKINDMKEVAVEFDKKKELDRMIMSETSKQLDKFSNIFYNKVKLNSTISEF